MPSATHPEYSMVSPPARKRRREDDGEMQMSLSTFGSTQNLLSAINNNERLILPSTRGSASLFNVPRKIIPLPVNKKLRIAEDNHHEQLNNRYLHHNTTPSIQSQPSHFSHAHPDHMPATSASSHQTRPSITKINSSALLSPCHICHRKPTKKSDFDSFADCMGCGQRTCFVCLRACQGWLSSSNRDESNQAAAEDEDLSVSFIMQDVDDEETTQNHTERARDAQKSSQRQKKGVGGGEEGSWSGRGHREVICSRCCVERGSEGDVVCLGCLAGMEGA
ncbi:hypothetical protein F5Y19DRAFT_1698 [Xylariaceae sp. FL1651]|nr:hypothetical protein F5Y19DRAFT_1698 [Xylariaceae sp. FL1651]